MPSEPEPGAVVIDCVISAPFMENTYVLRRAGRQDCVIVDPGLQPQKIMALLDAHRLTPAMILLTHGHADHIGGNRALKQRWPDVPLVIGVGDAPLLTDAILNLSGLAGQPVTSPPADRTVREGEQVATAGFVFDVLDIPGHSPGHVVYVLGTESPPIVIGGDVLFEGSIGRCDFPGGDQALLVSGIRKKLFTLPEGTVVYPGHGGTTTVGEEARSNPFCGVHAGRYELS